MNNIKLTSEELWAVLCLRIDQNMYKNLKTHLSLKEATEAFLRALKEDIKQIKELNNV